MTARATFKQADIERACKGAIAAGLPVARVIIVDGRIEVIIGDGESGDGGPNPLEQYLNGKKA